MATILHFPATRGGDWTPSERAGLDELAARLAAEAAVEVAFGRSDSGDPWCVVLDARDEVLVHVAREGSRFVAHTADDLFVTSTDLRTAVERVLGSRWQEERVDSVVPFAAAGRSAQVVTAVLVVASFVHHYRAEAEPSDDWSFAAARPLKAGARESRDQAAKTVVPLDVDPTPAADPGAPPPQSAEALALPVAAAAAPLAAEPPARHPASAAPEAAGLAVAARTIETAAAIREAASHATLTGTPGDDLLDAGRAPPRTHDLLDAGDGNDVLIVHESTVAIGGDGADRFVVAAPATPSASQLLGVLVDFDSGVDSILSGVPGRSTVTVLASDALVDILADPGVSFAPAPALPGHRLTLDLDGDGRADGYLLVNGTVPDAALLDAVREAFAPDAGAAPPPATTLPDPILPDPIDAAMIIPQPEII
jgi:hypothetical protein